MNAVQRRDGALALEALERILPDYMRALGFSVKQEEELGNERALRHETRAAYDSCNAHLARISEPSR